jgi:amidophosphoribosyltransferase
VLLRVIYFARPDSVMGGKSLDEARGNMGRELARESPANADIVITMPDSGTPAAIGFANESGLASRSKEHLDGLS